MFSVAPELGLISVQFLVGSNCQTVYADVPMFGISKAFSKRRWDFCVAVNSLKLEYGIEEEEGPAELLEDFPSVNLGWKAFDFNF